MKTLGASGGTRRVPGGGVRAALYSYCSPHAYRCPITKTQPPHSLAHTKEYILILTTSSYSLSVPLFVRLFVFYLILRALTLGMAMHHILPMWIDAHIRIYWQIFTHICALSASFCICRICMAIPNSHPSYVWPTQCLSGGGGGVGPLLIQEWQRTWWPYLRFECWEKLPR